MDDFKTMKIRVTDSNREAVKAALLAKGYEPSGKMADKPIFDEALAYYTYGGDFVLCSTGEYWDGGDYFDCHDNPEYILHNGEFIPAEEYYKQPESSVSIDFSKGCLYGNGNINVNSVSFQVPPIGVKPRYVHEALRLQEILQGMLNFSQAGKVIPKAWREELTDLLCKQEMMEGK